MKTLDVDRLYICLVRDCIPDFVMSYSDEGKIVEPRPDFVEHNILLYLDKIGKFVDLNNKGEDYVYAGNSTKIDNYQEAMILSYKRLYSEDVKFKKVSKKQAYSDFSRWLVESKFVPVYGYSEYVDGKAKVKRLVRGRDNIYADLLENDNKKRKV